MGFKSALWDPGNLKALVNYKGGSDGGCALTDWAAHAPSGEGSVARPAETLSARERERDREIGNRPASVFSSFF